MPEIAKGKIGNALTSTAADHVVAVSNDIYDESLNQYQSAFNKNLEVLSKTSSSVVEVSALNLGSPLAIEDNYQKYFGVIEHERFVKLVYVTDATPDDDELYVVQEVEGNREYLYILTQSFYSGDIKFDRGFYGYDGKEFLPIGGEEINNNWDGGDAYSQYGGAQSVDGGDAYE